MFEGENRVLGNFKRVFIEHYTHADPVFESPFKKIAYNDDLKYYQRVSPASSTWIPTSPC
jgi:hypothetical protein